MVDYVAPEKKPCRLCEETNGACPKCDGRGKNPWDNVAGSSKGRSSSDAEVICPMCNGNCRCTACGGTGWI